MSSRASVLLVSILFATLTACSDDTPGAGAGNGNDGGSASHDGSASIDSGGSGSDASDDGGSKTNDDSGSADDAGGGGDDGGADDAGSDAATGPFTLTSSAIAQNATVPQAYTCATQSTQNAQGTGGDASPPLAWSGAPSGTLSFAVVLHDQGNGNTHWVLYDIAPTVTSLPKGIAKTATVTTPAGAKQTKSYDGSYGYMGPCPNVKHTYTFTVYAMPKAATAGITAGDRAGAEKTIKAAAIGSAVLTVTSSDSQG
jgi:Raf kinase inhibitor-like YbhB/YbcL family protein